MKKAAGLAMALALCFGLCGMPAQAAVPTSVATWDDLAAAVAEAAATPGDYTITIAAPLAVTGSATLDGQGATVTLVRGVGVTGDLITLPAGQSLGLQNITIDGGGAGVPGVVGPLIHSAGDLQIGGGALLRNNLATGGLAGGGVYVAGGGTLALAEGGAISGNAVSDANGYGGGVYVASGGGFAMTGGAIGGTGAANTARAGAGVYIDHAATGAVSISGGVIGGNEAAQDGGGLYLNGGTAELSGAEISGNTARYGGGAYVNQASGRLNVRSAAIRGNTASVDGGGVFVQDDAQLFVTGVFPSAGAISGNAINSGYGTDVCLYDIDGAGIMGVSGFVQIGTGGGGIYDANNGSGGQTQNIYVAGPMDYANGASIVVEGISQTPAPGVIVAKAFGSAYGGSYDTLTNDDRNTFTYVNRAGQGYRVYLADAGGVGAAAPDRLVLGDFDLQEEVYEAPEGGTVAVPAAGYGMAATLHISGRDGLAPKTVALTGGDVYRQAFTGTLAQVPAGSGLILKDITLRGSDENGDSPASGSLVWVGGAFSLETGARLTANNGTADGAAIYVSGPGAVARISGGVVSGNTAAASGAVYVGGGGQLAISGGEITGNTARQGGGVYVAAGGQAIASGGTVSGNNPQSARDMYLEYAGGVAGKLALSGAPVIGRQAAGGAYTGGVYNALPGSAGGNVTFAGGLLPGALVVVDGAFDPAAAPVLAVADPALYPALGEGDRSAVHYVDSAYTVQFNNPASPTALVLAAPPVPVTGVTVSPAALALAPGDTAALTAVIVPANATNRAVSWQSSNPSIATVDANGLVTALAPGRTVITATTADGGFTATCTVTVTAESSSASSSSSSTGSSSGSGEGTPGGINPGSPPTGDAAPLALWLPLALAALAGLAGTRFLQYFRRRSAILASERPRRGGPACKK